MRRLLWGALVFSPFLLNGCGPSAADSVSFTPVKSSSGITLPVPSGWKAFPCSINSELVPFNAFLKENTEIAARVKPAADIPQSQIIGFSLKSKAYCYVMKTPNSGYSAADENMRAHLVQLTRDSYNFKGLPDAGIADFDSRKAVLIRGLVPAREGDVYIEQYTFVQKYNLYTAAFVYPASEESQVRPLIHPMLKGLELPKE